MITMKKILYSILILSLFCLPNISKAEVQIGVLDSDVNLEIYPENPQPYENVTITLTSYATDMNKAMIEWRSGNKLILSGYGKTSYSFRTLGPNTSTSFEVTIVPSEIGGKITKNFTINPSEVDLLWESIDGYTPPFYKGKSLTSREGVIKVVAIPNTNAIKSGKGDISYMWKNGDKASTGASGYNKDSYVFANSVLNLSEKVTVGASSVDGAYSAVKEIEIPMYQPKIIFYKKSPTEGVLYSNAINENTLFPEDEITITAVPYFLPIKGNESIFNYNWSINGDDIATPSKKTELTIRPASRGGYADISIIFENLSKTFQRITGKLRLTL